MSFGYIVLLLNDGVKEKQETWGWLALKGRRTISSPAIALPAGRRSHPRLAEVRLLSERSRYGMYGL